MDREVEELIQLKQVNGYLRIKYLVEELSLKEAIKLVDYRKKITDNKPCYILADVNSIKRSSKEVKNYFANEGAELVIGSALCFNTKSSTLITNFFLFLVHPKVKLKAFDNCKKADLWLQSLM